ncbi:MAG: hypothetical protein K9W46_10040 [Candidatus Heimdallarchaeum endolithica]|uniref:Uncharacterized protein n=1 Tax=Candidatus Heimdallarchaeum endolithica TaxID=2876572 RepID=A0A9Y1FNB1_9ARCH|nr:MAG: hypothetical protein K9W46_10040 [Candidatus Heimdallarchaeum endolithica]
MENSLKYCPICKKEKSGKDTFCEIHEKAKKSLLEGYELWLRAYGILSWEAYLKELSILDESVGKTVKEVIDYERFFKK